MITKDFLSYLSNVKIGRYLYLVIMRQHTTMIDFDDDNCRIGTAYTDFNFKKCLCILFLSAK